MVSCLRGGSCLMPSGQCLPSSCAPDFSSAAARILQYSWCSHTLTQPPPRMRSVAVPPSQHSSVPTRGSNGSRVGFGGPVSSVHSSPEGVWSVVWFPRRAVCVRAAPRGAWCIQRSGFVLLSSSRWFGGAPRRVLAWRPPPEGDVRCCVRSALFSRAVSGMGLE